MVGGSMGKGAARLGSSLGRSPGRTHLANSGDWAIGQGRPKAKEGQRQKPKNPSKKFKPLV
ncbi:hypothetical protein AMR42_04025 [Limnothrix sp. PR1529]|nr:hypothetical protein BCR12_16555 [Limnothrix sp. P13C2]PIB14858.1 hypothetical protein AMR42_04025 [Limnothrix sp. PR1529]